MNRVEIALNGPVMENLCDVVVRDDYDSSEVTLDQADVAEAKAQGQAEVLSLILDNGAGGEILRAALSNGSPVSLDGEDVSPETLAAALDAPAPAP